MDKAKSANYAKPDTRTNLWYLLVMKIVIIVIVTLLLVLQFQLWFGKDGLTHTIRLRHVVAMQMKENQILNKQNKKLEKEVVVLKKGRGMVENLARSQMGMAKPGEKYYQFVKVEKTNKRKSL